MNRLTHEIARSLASVTGLFARANQARVGTRVLLFHDISTKSSTGDIYSIPHSRFGGGIERLANWAVSHDVQFVPFSESPVPGVTVTFDDGYKSTLEIAAPILVNRAIPFHVFLTRDFARSNNSRYLNEADIQRLLSLPLASVGIHGTSHQRLSSLPTSQVKDEIRGARAWLEDLTGRPITTISYPHGSFNDAVVDILREEQFTAAACSSVGTYRDHEHRLQIPRVDIWSLDRPQDLLRKTRGNWDFLLP